MKAYDLSGPQSIMKIKAITTIYKKTTISIYERKRHEPGNRTFPDYLVRTPLPPCFLVTAVYPVTAVTIFGRYLVILANILADIHVFMSLG